LGYADSVQVSIADDDAAGIELHGAGPAQPLTVWESAPGAPSPAPQVYQIRLTSQPLAPVSVSLLQSSTQGGEDADAPGGPGLLSLDPVALTIAPADWRQWLTVSVSAAQDDVASGRGRAPC
jgi:hypothetical protein